MIMFFMPVIILSVSCPRDFSNATVLEKLLLCPTSIRSELLLKLYFILFFLLIKIHEIRVILIDGVVREVHAHVLKVR